eukprot:TRINITY_DN2493_c0_g1_i1.p1 TRINITY_DN2493_c0_g1~~TRINITY_DN2493_c0_g1_i1.p1  ORF type:complete len:396 (+),score=116.24 TRINITY_DN2493_c0_g1_i1:109-1296(+)
MDAVINGLPTTALKVLFDADNKKGEDTTAKPKKSYMKNAVLDAYKLTTVKVLLESLTVEQLYLLAKPLKLEEKQTPIVGKDGKEKPVKPVKSGNILRKRLTESMLERGVQAYLEEAEQEVLELIAERIDVDTKQSKAALIDEIIGDIEEAGSLLYLESFSEDILRDLAFEMKLLKSATAAPRKAVIIESILNNKEVPKKEKPKKKKEEVTVSKKKPKLVKGVQYQDVFQHYYLDELVAFAKEHKIKAHGAKKDLIHRIIAWLEGDKENTMVGQRKAPKRRKGAKKATSKKASTTTEEGETDAPAKPTKKQTSNTTKEVADQKDEAAESVIDLDRLDRLTVSELKKYCLEEGLNLPANAKKKDYVLAIEKYNASDNDEQQDDDGEDDHPDDTQDQA